MQNPELDCAKEHYESSVISKENKKALSVISQNSNLPIVEKKSLMVKDEANSDLVVNNEKNVSIKQSKPVMKTCNLLPNMDIKQVALSDTDTNENIPEDDINHKNFSEAIQNNKEVKNRPKPLPRPRHNPPAKPKSNPPPRPAAIHVKPRITAPCPQTKSSSSIDKEMLDSKTIHSSSPPKVNISVNVDSKHTSPVSTPAQKSNELCVGDQTMSSSQTSKSITRKESASKTIDLIKKKGVQFKEKSIKVFRSRSSCSETEISGTNNSCQSNSSANVAVDKNTLPQADNKKPVHDSATSNILVQRSSSERRAPPPRPALPSVLKTRHPSEGFVDNKGLISKTFLSDNGKETTFTLTEKKNTEHSLQDLSKQSTNADKPIEKAIEVEPVCQNSKSDDDSSIAAKTESLYSTVKQKKPTAKPARPPPIKFNSSVDAISAKKITQAEKTQEEDSFLELLQKKTNTDKAKPEVDAQMKEYISSETYCIALSDYNAENFTDISFKAGEKILVLRKLDDVLLFGRNEDGEEGPFPSKYVDVDDN